MLMARPKKAQSNSNQDGTSAGELEGLSFEEAYQRLGEIVETLENGGLPLAEATSVYEQSMALVQRCNQLLDNAELKISQLRDSYQSRPSADTLDWDEDEDVDPEP
jgi:exodeoxyribonuclease VII small subunit